MQNIRSLVKECVLNVLMEDLQSQPKSKAVDPKTIQVLQKWMEAGSRDAAKRLIDYVLKRQIGLGVEDLADTATLANGLESVAESLDQQDWRGAIDIAKDTATEMIQDEGGLDEVNHTKNDRGNYTISVGADNSLERAKREHPNAIKQLVRVLIGRFKTPKQHPVNTHEKLKTTIHDAATLMASRAFQEKWLVPLIVQAVEEAYWGNKLTEDFNTSPQEPSEDAYYVEYVSQRPNEVPFQLHGNKFEYVNGKYPDGKVDIAVYAFAGDVVYGYKAFRKMMRLDIHSPNEKSQTTVPNEAFDPTSVGPNPDASEGNSVYDPYQSMNAKMRQMESNPKWEAEGRCGQCGTPGSKCNCKILKRVQAYLTLAKKIDALQSTNPSSPELKDLLAQKNTEEPWVRDVLKQAGYGHQSRPYLRENMGRYAQLAGATDLKETIELTPTGGADDWSRPIYRDKNGKIYVDVNLGKGEPSIHDVTDEGEPLTPIKNFKIVGIAPSRYANALCPRCKNSKPELMTTTPDGKKSCTSCHWEENPGEPVPIKEVKYSGTTPSGIKYSGDIDAPLRKNAMVDKDKPCTHPNGFEWSGTTPMTGYQVCRICGARKPSTRKQVPRLGQFQESNSEEKVNKFLSKFGLGPNYKKAKRKTYPCPDCKGSNAYYVEDHPDCDGGMNEMALECPDCKK